MAEGAVYVYGVLPASERAATQCHDADATQSEDDRHEDQERSLRREVDTEQMHGLNRALPGAYRERTEKVVCRVTRSADSNSSAGVPAPRVLRPLVTCG